MYAWSVNVVVLLLFCERIIDAVDRRMGWMMPKAFCLHFDHSCWFYVNLYAGNE